MNAFVTGSRAYGSPRPNSDTDLAVLMSLEDLQALEDGLDLDPDGSGRGRSDIMTASYRLNDCNLLVFTDPAQFEVWRKATVFLKTKRPVTRDKAVKYICRKLQKAGYCDQESRT